MCGFELVDARTRRSRFSAHFFGARAATRPELVGGSFGARTMLEPRPFILGVRVVIAVFSQLLDIEKSRKEVPTIFSAAFIDQLEDEALTAAGAMNEHVFECDQLV